MSEEGKLRIIHKNFDMKTRRRPSKFRSLPLEFQPLLQIPNIPLSYYIIISTYIPYYVCIAIGNDMKTHTITILYYAATINVTVAIFTSYLFYNGETALNTVHL